MRRFHTICLTLIAVSVLPSLLNGAEVEKKNVPVNMPGAVQLVLPAKIYGVAGVEMNLYFDNVALMLNRRNYLIEVTCKKGSHYQDRWTFTPTEKDIGQYLFLLKIKNAENKIIATAVSQVHIVTTKFEKDRKLSPKTMLIIGDSLTAASHYPQRLIDLAKSRHYPSLHLIGTKGNVRGKPGKMNRHEGYGGWTALRFATLYDEKHPTNRSPFMYKEKGKKPALDFARYCKEQNNGKAPDVVTIFLAPNDIFRATDKTIEQKMKVMLKHYDQLIAMVHKFNPRTKIGVMLPVPPSASQDAFAGYKTTKTRWEYRRHQHLLRTRMIAKYGNRTKENISIVPLAVNLDCVNNYPTKTVAINAHVSTKIKRLSNAVHPAKSGYFQIGDSLYAWLCAESVH